MSVDNNQTSKAFPYSSFIPFYFNGLGISNDATTPLTKLDVAAGSCLDSTGTFQLTLSTAVVINGAANGLNGLDTGTLAASTVYAVYVVCDPVTQQAAGAMISLAYGSKAINKPLLPFGYSAYALIGFVTTDASVHFLAGYWSDNDSARRIFTYDAPIIALSGGTSNTYAGVDLSAFVPGFNNVQVVIYSNFTANAAADVEKLQGYNSTGDAVTIVAPVAGATAHTTSQNSVLAQLNTLAPSIKYTVSAGAVSLYVCGYTFDL